MPTVTKMSPTWSKDSPFHLPGARDVPWGAKRGSEITDHGKTHPWCNSVITDLPEGSDATTKLSSGSCNLLRFSKQAQSSIMCKGLEGVNVVSDRVHTRSFFEYRILLTNAPKKQQCFVIHHAGLGVSFFWRLTFVNLRKTKLVNVHTTKGKPKRLLEKKHTRKIWTVQKL